MVKSGGAFVVVYGGATGSSKTLWSKDGTIYCKGACGHPSPISAEMLQRNGFAPEEALHVLNGLCTRKDLDMDVIQLLAQFSCLSEWLNTASGHISTRDYPVPIEVVLDLVP